MNIELAILNDGRISMVSDKPLPDVVQRVEYYRDQRLFQLVYNDELLEDELMECEIPENMVVPVEKSPNVIIMTIIRGLDPLGYKAPLIKVGELY
ncbi:MAG: hypothetical protein JKY71_05980 [Alphaproteobacteria bacterium]|nr:hypothetical protein [Alphaproteobacteria bacterium]